MEVLTKHIKISTHGNSEVVDITQHIVDILNQQRMKEGHVTIFVVGSTASISTTEFEPGLRKDIPEMLERIAPSNTRYHHDDTWGDGNGHAHVRASILGPSLIVPFSEGKLLLGIWQQIILIDFDNKARHRDIVVQLMGT